MASGQFGAFAGQPAPPPVPPPVTAATASNPSSPSGNQNMHQSMPPGIPSMQQSTSLGASSPPIMMPQATSFQLGSLATVANLGTQSTAVGNLGPSTTAAGVGIRSSLDPATPPGIYPPSLPGVHPIGPPRIVAEEEEEQPKDVDEGQWTEHIAEDGRVYWHQTSSGKSTWEKPWQLLTQEERFINAQTKWKLFTASNSRSYWHNTKTGQSLWTLPDEVSALKERFQDICRQLPPLEPEMPETPEGEAEGEAVTKPRKVIPEEVAWPVYEKREAKQKIGLFYELKTINLRMKWEEVSKLLAQDSRASAFSKLTTGEKKQALAEYHAQQSKRIREFERKAKSKAREEMLDDLQNWTGMHPAATYREFAAAFHSAVWWNYFKEAERDEIFQEHADEVALEFRRRKKNFEAPATAVIQFISRVIPSPLSIPRGESVDREEDAGVVEDVESDTEAPGRAEKISEREKQQRQVRTRPLISWVEAKERLQASVLLPRNVDELDLLAAWTAYTDRWLEGERGRRLAAITSACRERRRGFWSLLEAAECAGTLDLTTEWVAFLKSRSPNADALATGKENGEEVTVAGDPLYFQLVGVDGPSPREYYLLYQDLMIERYENIRAMAKKKLKTIGGFDLAMTLSAFITLLSADSRVSTREDGEQSVEEDKVERRSKKKRKSCELTAEEKRIVPAVYNHFMKRAREKASTAEAPADEEADDGSVEHETKRAKKDRKSSERSD